MRRVKDSIQREMKFYSLTGDAIQVALSSALLDFGTENERLVLVLRDDGSSMAKACYNWDVALFGCIGHCLHLVVGPFLLERRGHMEEPTEMN
ncbi:hypothetical protein PybrP1_007770 [[Pythium] brassicae (nom. inval.)]|nr:hypothetical protein PybrP1_007770 [[Pythium] brassicae (nom. inval.)]